MFCARCDKPIKEGTAQAVDVDRAGADAVHPPLPVQATQDPDLSRVPAEADTGGMNGRLYAPVWGGHGPPPVPPLTPAAGQSSTATSSLMGTPKTLAMRWRVDNLMSSPYSAR
jgi:hypothetical protein